MRRISGIIVFVSYFHLGEQAWDIQRLSWLYAGHWLTMGARGSLRAYYQAPAPARLVAEPRNA